MDVKDLSNVGYIWKQIKELAEMAMKNGSDFSLTLCADGDCSIDISKHDYRVIPITTTPSTTWNNSPTPIRDIMVNGKIGDVSDNPYAVK